MIYLIKLNSWTQLILKSVFFPAFIFRGQPSANWDLSTTIERISYGNDSYLKYLDNREEWILMNFRRRAHNLIDKPPEYGKLIEWLALLQHHGGPTRLLDFTKSLFVALYFACESASGDAAIWMIDYHHLLDTHSPQSNKYTIYNQQSSIVDMAINLIGKKGEKAGIMPIEPEMLSERMSIQQGLSIMPMDINKTFMMNLRDHYEWSDIKYKEMSLTNVLKKLYIEKPRVIKIVIKKSWISEILRFLDTANINANSLFPGLDGYAKSLSIHLR